jgi:hypothetical protein
MSQSDPPRDPTAQSIAALSGTPPGAAHSGAGPTPTRAGSDRQQDAPSTGDSQAAVTASGEHPFLQQILVKDKRKREAAAAAEERRQKLEPLYEAVRRVDGTLYGVQGPEKPPQQTCEEAAAALVAGFKALRAALGAVGKEGALDALRREAPHASERHWLLDAVLQEMSVGDIAKVLQMADRSNLHRAWQDLAVDCVNWPPGKTPDPANAPAPAGPPTTGVAEEPATARTETGSRVPDPALSALQYDILQVLRQLKATDPEKRVTASAIAEKVGGDATEQGCKAPLADLKRRGLAGSKTGRGGGTWLTTDGLALINRVRKP